jgi:hypothetical protein
LKRSISYELETEGQPVSDACEAQIFAIGDAPQKYKQHLAYDYLKESIISGKFPSNKPLIERELCDTLVSAAQRCAKRSAADKRRPG